MFASTADTVAVIAAVFSGLVGLVSAIFAGLASLRARESRDTGRANARALDTGNGKTIGHTVAAAHRVAEHNAAKLDMGDLASEVRDLNNMIRREAGKREAQAEAEEGVAS